MGAEHGIFKQINPKKAKVKVRIKYTQFDDNPEGTEHVEVFYSFMYVKYFHAFTAARDYLINKYGYQFIVVDDVSQKKLNQR
jgi:hypothetical protein